VSSLPVGYFFIFFLLFYGVVLRCFGGGRGEWMSALVVIIYSVNQLLFRKSIGIAAIGVKLLVSAVSE